MRRAGEDSTLPFLVIDMQIAPNTPFWLVVEGKTFALAPGEYLLGRAPDCDICFPNDTQLSRRHARMVVTMSQVEVEDLGSSNGTWIGATLVQHRMYLKEQEVLRVGKQELTLQRSHTARDRRSSTTQRDMGAVVPQAHWAQDAGLSELPTFDGTPAAMVQKEADALLRAGRSEDARRLVEPVLKLLDRTGRELPTDELERVSVLALRLFAATRDRYFADWVLTQHTRQAALMSENTAAALLECLDGDLKIDESKARQYLTTLRPAAPDMSAEELLRCARLETTLTPRR